MNEPSLTGPPACLPICEVHTSVSKSIPPLKALGWRIVQRDLPFPLSAIENQEYALNVKTNGCCGHLELLKLHACSLVEYAW